MSTILHINILTESSTPNSRALNNPIIQNKRLLLDMGIKVLFFWNEPYNNRLFDCDVMCINSKVFRDFF